jgi:hypothetical protein
MSTGTARGWTIKTTADVRQWLRSLRQTDPESYRSANVTIDLLAETGPGLGRPLVDTLQGSSISNWKELRPRSGRDVAIRVLFAFDPWSQAVLLTAGNKQAIGPGGTNRRSPSLRSRT